MKTINLIIHLLWHPDQNSLESWFLYNSPVSSLSAPTNPVIKKCHHNMDDSKEEQVTSLIDYRHGTTPTTWNPLGISSTLILDDFLLFNLHRVDKNCKSLICLNQVYSKYWVLPLGHFELHLSFNYPVC